MDFTAPFCDVNSTVNNCESEILNFNLKNSEKTLIENTSLGSGSDFGFVESEEQNNKEIDSSMSDSESDQAETSSDSGYTDSTDPLTCSQTSESLESVESGDTKMSDFLQSLEVESLNLKKKDLNTFETNFDTSEIAQNGKQAAENEIESFIATENGDVCYFDRLPMEMVIYIISFLDINDLKKVALVCRRWLSVLLLKKFAKNMMLNFNDTYYKEFNVQISQFSNTLRTFPIVSISTSNFDIASKSFWIEYGDRIKELYFRNGIMRKAEFEECVRYTPNLEVLKIEGNNLFRTWDIRGTYHERLISFPNCYHIGLTRNSYMGKKLFEYIVAMAPNVRELDFSFCMRKMPGVERNRFLDHLIFYLKGYGANIKLLNFSNTITDDYFLNQLSEVRFLKLKSLNLTFNGSLDKKEGIMPLFAVQNEMEHLDLTESPAVEETLCIHIAKNMKNLKTLILRKCHNITDYCIREVSKLVELETLDISGCDYVTDEGIYDGLIKGTPKKNLKKLYFAFLSNLSDSIMFRIGIKYHKQLTELDLAGTSISDECLQVIIKHFSLLRYLSVDSCCKLTDYGFTGRHPSGRIYYPISGLRGLRVLKMAMCHKVTDEALIDCFKFKELRELNFSRTNFTEAGIKAVVENCPSIETFDLTECEKVYDTTVEVIVKNLKRLQTLKLNGIYNVTDYSFDYIYQNCSEIKNLYLRNCENLKADRIADQLYYMRTLRKVYLD